MYFWIWLWLTRSRTGAGELLVDSGWCGCQSEVVGHIWRPSQRSQVPINLSRFQNWACSSRFAYGRSDVVLMCFDIGRAQSLENCRWGDMRHLSRYEEAKQFKPKHMFQDNVVPADQEVLSPGKYKGWTHLLKYIWLTIDADLCQLL